MYAYVCVCVCIRSYVLYGHMNSLHMPVRSEIVVRLFVKLHNQVFGGGGDANGNNHQIFFTLQFVIWVSVVCFKYVLWM